MSIISATELMDAVKLKAIVCISSLSDLAKIYANHGYL